MLAEKESRNEPRSCRLPVLRAPCAFASTLLFRSALEIKRADIKVERAGITVDMGKSSVFGIPVKNMVVVKGSREGFVPWAYGLLIAALVLELVAVAMDGYGVFCGMPTA